jgi:hypothetical protein
VKTKRCPNATAMSRTNAAIEFRESVFACKPISGHSLTWAFVRKQRDVDWVTAARRGRRVGKEIGARARGGGRRPRGRPRRPVRIALSCRAPAVSSFGREDAPSCAQT